MSWRKLFSIRKNHFHGNFGHETSPCFPSSPFPLSPSIVEIPPPPLLNDTFWLNYSILSLFCLFLLIILLVVQNQLNSNVVFPDKQLNKKFCWWVAMNFILLCIANLFHLFLRFDPFVQAHSHMQSHRWSLNGNFELNFFILKRQPTSERVCLKNVPRSILQAVHNEPNQPSLIKPRETKKQPSGMLLLLARDTVSSPCQLRFFETPNGHSRKLSCAKHLKHLSLNF